jgi:signal transduction histidine kinase
VSTRASSMTSGVRQGRPGGRERRRLLPRLRDARIRSKLALILVVPVLAIVGLATARLVDSGRQAVDAELVRSLTDLSTDINALSDNVQKERMAAAGFLANLPGADQVTEEQFKNQVKQTDDRITAYTRARNKLGDVPDSVKSRLDNIDNKLETINDIRQQVRPGGTIAVSEVVTRYGVIITDLSSYGEVIGQIAGEGSLADSERALAAFSQDKAATGEEQATAFGSLVDAGGTGLTQEQLSSITSTQTTQQAAQVAFSLAANRQLQALVASSVTGDAVFLADQTENALARSVGVAPQVTPGDVSRSLGAVVNLKRFAEQRMEQQVLADADDERAAVLRQVLVESVLVLVVLAIAITLAVVLARSLVRSLGRLREGALSVAHRDLPDAVARLRDVRSLGEGGPEEIARQVRDPIRLSNKDEVGQVAVAFNVVHREAVRIAAEQAALRTSVSAMFLNLARRSQALVDRMIGELDKIERGEEDPKRLAQLFQLDHLATRMRRNDENLLVLAGADSSAPRREDALLVDALRAAQSEVEQYDRIEFGTVDTDVSVAAHAVNDVVRLVAELLDNATRFSPPNAAVVADARRVRDYVLIQIEDRGLGMSDEQLAALNARLAEPPSVDVAAFRMMGLAVVSRLASRYQIRVELRHNPEGGTVAQISLPASILILPRVRQREPLMARPRQPLPLETAPAAANRSAWPSSPAPALTARTSTLTEPAPADSQWQLTPPMVAPQPAAPARPRNDDTTELPIFREMEAVWFRTRGQRSTPDAWSMPTAGYPPPPVVSVASPVSGAGGFGNVNGPASAPPTSAPASPAPPAPPARPMAPPVSPGRPTQPPPAGYRPPDVPAAAAGSGGPSGGSGGDDHLWRTAADEGWQRASAAAEPAPAGITRSGLPKRVPQAQLVPGGVEPAGGPDRSKRTPDEVRGLLSAYHRGVQRGRTAGAGNGQSRTTEENPG